MEKMATLVSCLLLVVGVVTAQTAAPTQTNRPLPQWLTGMIAVSGFLFLSFVVLLVKKAWCEDPNRGRNSAESVRENEFVMSDTFETDLGVNRRNDIKPEQENEPYYATSRNLRSKDDVNAYDNLVIDISEEKVTSM